MSRTISICFDRPINGVDRTDLEASRGYVKREKVVCSWANSRRVRPLHLFFADDINYMSEKLSETEAELLASGYAEAWYSPEDLIATCEALLITSTEVAKKQPTCRVLIEFLDEVMSIARLAQSVGVKVHLSES